MANQKRRDQIATAALDLFDQRGYHERAFVAVAGIEVAVLGDGRDELRIPLA